MSLVDVDKLELTLNPETIKSIYGIDIHTHPYYSGVEPEKINYSETKYSKQYFHSSFIEIWYPGPYYGCIWRYAGYQLTNNMVCVQFIDFPGQDWTVRSELCFEGLTIEEFDILYQALIKKDFDTLSILHDQKPFIPK